MLKYIELKSGYAGNGPAWIGRVKQSKSGRTVYFNGKAFKKLAGGGLSGNHADIETGEEYWISGIKKDGQDRHWSGSGRITIEAAAVSEYLRVIGSDRLDERKFLVSHSIVIADPSKFHELENEKLS